MGAKRSGGRRQTTSSGEPTQTRAPWLRNDDRAGKVKLTSEVPAELRREVSDAVDFLSGPPERLTLTAFVTAALASELQRLKKIHRRGEPFPQRQGELKRGRRLGS